MEKSAHPVLDFIASLMGIFDVDWDSDFASDGCSDLWGRDVGDEPLFMPDKLEDPLPDILIPIPQQHRPANVSGE